MNRRMGYTVLAIILIGGSIMVLWSQKAQTQKLISPKETYERTQRDSTVLLLDVRTPEEYNNELGHVANAILIPVQELEQRVSELEQYKGKTIIAICRSGNRSGKAADLLARKGFTALNMEGGMIRWNDEHLPVARDSVKQ
ncbi:MAG: rhodanese-related sulfurtransferase [Bacteroidetes bacterium]|nr:rhodanese-related sulfurtransferase [Bacteroidota bacterium]